MQINIKDIWSASVRRTHNEYVRHILHGARLAPGSLLSVLISRHYDDFALGRPKRLRNIINTAKEISKFSCKATYADFLGECKAVFDYGKFSDKNTKGWNAYRLCETSKYQMCPYCQQAGALTIFRDSDDMAFRPTLDHFYPKAQYPFLALSLFNLVPSCHTCNSSLKTTKDFYVEPHLHPFEDQEFIRFTWNIDDYRRQREGVGPMAGSLASTGVGISLIQSANPKQKAIKNSIKTFLIEERLNLNLHSLRNFQEAVLVHTPASLAEINAKVFSQAGWQLTEEVALQFSYRDYKNEWHGRIKADLRDIAWGRR